MSFIYQRIVRFHETDAAGVVYFANVLNLCHEAYEASLAASGVNLKIFFGGSAIAIPIVHADIDFRRPMFCGDLLKIDLTPHSQDPSSFEITYQITEDTANARPLAKALTRHVCIDTTERNRHPFATRNNSMVAAVALERLPYFIKVRRIQAIFYKPRLSSQAQCTLGYSVFPCPPRN